MKVLIVYAHPDPDSFNHAVLETIAAGARDGGHHVTVIDLYQEKFDPVLVFNETKRRRDLQNDPETANYRQLVWEAEHLIFIYPVWWYGLPAILKGFIDRVLVSGFAFTYDGIIPKGLLQGKSAWVVYTIDSPGWYVSLFRFNAEWTVMNRAILRFCGIRNVKRMMFAGSKGSTQQRRQKWLAYLERQARSLRQPSL